MLKTLPTMCEPDERFQHLSFHDQAAGHIRPLCAGDLYNDVSSIELSLTVPAEICSQFDVARNAYLCSWFVYDFTVLAEQHSYIVLEMSLRHRAKSEGLSSNKTLKPYLLLAIKHGWLRKEELDIPGTSDSRPMSFLKELPGLRDRLAHGKLHLSPEFTLTMMRTCAELINKLYP